MFGFFFEIFKKNFVVFRKFFAMLRNFFENSWKDIYVDRFNVILVERPIYLAMNVENCIRTRTLVDLYA